MRGFFRGHRVAIVAAIVVIALVAGGATFVYHQRHKSAHRDIGMGVAVDGANLPDDLRAEKAPAKARQPFKLVKPLAPVVAIEAKHQPTGDVTLTLPLKQVVAVDATVLVATNATGTADNWTLMSGTVTSDGRHVQVATRHFSWWQPLLLNVKGAVKELKKTFLDGMTSEVFTQAKPPKCKDEDKARTDGYEISSDSKDTIYWCFGVDEHGKRVVKVVNHRSYPLEVEQSGLHLQSAGTGGLDLAQLARIGHAAIIMPGETAVFTLVLRKGKKARLDTKLSKTALGLHAVETIAEAAVTLALHTNVGASVKQLQLTGKALGGKGCLDTLSDPANIGRMIKSCFDEKLLAETFGWRAALLAPAMLAFSLIDLTKAMANAWGDSKNGRARYGITIRRADLEAAFAPYVGTWKTLDSILAIRSDYTGVLHFLPTVCDHAQLPMPGCGEPVAIRFTVTASGVVGKDSSTGTSDYSLKSGGTLIQSIRHPSGRENITFCKQWTPSKCS